MFQFNDPWRLPPVGCNLVILVGGQEITVSRTSHITNKYGDNLEYMTDNGDILIGRFEWRYP